MKPTIPIPSTENNQKNANKNNKKSINNTYFSSRSSLSPSTPATSSSSSSFSSGTRSCLIMLVLVIILATILLVFALSFSFGSTTTSSSSSNNNNKRNVLQRVLSPFSSPSSSSNNNNNTAPLTERQKRSQREIYKQKDDAKNRKLLADRLNFIENQRNAARKQLQERRNEIAKNSATNQIASLVELEKTLSNKLKTLQKKLDKLSTAKTNEFFYSSDDNDNDGADEDDGHTFSRNNNSNNNADHVSDLTLAQNQEQKGGRVEQDEDESNSRSYASLKMLSSPRSEPKHILKLKKLFFGVNRSRMILSKRNGEAVCKLLLLGYDECADTVAELQIESIEECILRTGGIDRWGPSLVSVCSFSPYWRLLKTRQDLRILNNRRRNLEMEVAMSGSKALLSRHKPHPENPPAYVSPLTSRDLAGTSAVSSPDGSRKIYSRGSPQTWVDRAQTPFYPPPENCPPAPPPPPPPSDSVLDEAAQGTSPTLTTRPQQLSSEQLEDMKRKEEEEKLQKLKYSARNCCASNLCRRIPVSKRKYANLFGYKFIFTKNGKVKDEEDQEHSNNKTKKISFTFHASTFAISPKFLHFKRPSRLKLFDFGPNFASWMGASDVEAYLNPRRHDAQQGYDFGGDHEALNLLVSRHSRFCFGNFRGNSDRAGHLEMLSSGCILYVPDLLNRTSVNGADQYAYPTKFHLPYYRLLGYPRDLIIRAMTTLPGIQHWRYNNYMNKYFHRTVKTNVVKVPSIDHTRFDEEKYFEIADKMYEYTKNHLTCDALVAYVLKVIEYEEPKSVLLLMPRMDDYQSIMMECGFDALGLNYTTNFFSRGERSNWPPQEKREVEKFYDRKNRSQKLYGDDGGWLPSRHEWNMIEGETRGAYGAGFTFASKFDPPPNPRRTWDQLSEALDRDEFDLVVFACWYIVEEHRGNNRRYKMTDGFPIFPKIKHKIPWNRVVFIDGEDGPKTFFDQDPELVEMLNGGSKVFVRELGTLFTHYHHHAYRNVARDSITLYTPDGKVEHF